MAVREMAVDSSVSQAFENARKFLHPVLDRDEIKKSREGSLIERLAKALNLQAGNDEDRQREEVIGRALALLKGLHDALRANPKAAPGTGEGQKQEGSVVSEEYQRGRRINALIDLVSLEGIYPCLTPGVGIPLERRAIYTLPAGIVVRHQAVRDEGGNGHGRSVKDRFLSRIICSLDDILMGQDTDLWEKIMDRSRADLISGSAQLAFNSRSVNEQDRQRIAGVFQRVLDQSSTSSLLPILTAYLHEKPPEWFKAQISAQLGQIPLRPDGVIQTVVFLVSEFAPTLGQVEAPSSTGPPLTLQAIMQTSRLLSSVPQAMTADIYFQNISPKLYGLLDHQDGDLRRTAAYVIGSGILGKRQYGAPKTVGYETFARPILDCLNAVQGPSAAWLKRFALDGSVIADSVSSPFVGKENEGAHDDNALTDFDVLISEAQLSLSIDRLSCLVLSYPNPVLVRRLVSPVLLPLWGMLCYAREHKKTSWTDRAHVLLLTFFSIGAPLPRYELLIDNILWDGGERYTYAAGNEGGISLRKRSPRVADKQDFDPIHLMDIFDWHCDELLKFLGADPTNEEITGDLFLYASREWLLGSVSASKEGDTGFLGHPEDQANVVKKIVSAKLTEKLLVQYKETFARRPLKVLGVIKQMLESELLRFKSLKPRSALHIVKQEAKEEETTDITESLTAAFSLLSTILTAPGFSLTEEIRPLLMDMKTLLDSLLPNLPSSLTGSATTSSMLIEITLSGGQHAPPEQLPSVSTTEIDLQTHRQALRSLDSTLPPVQAEGLTLLSKLISKSSPILDIPSTLTLLLALLTDSSGRRSDDEFIYLNIIKAIGLLASRHQRTTVKKLAEVYADPEENVRLDQRLRVGEALLHTVQGLGEALLVDTAKTLSETLVTVASRRGKKPKAQKILEKERKQEEKSTVFVKQEPPVLPRDPDFDPYSESESESEDPAVTAHSEKILRAWARGVASDDQPDDLRARASAVSILASVIKTNIAAVGASQCRAAMDLAQAVLTLEAGTESAILRRAAVVLMLDILAAMDEANERLGGRGLGFGFTFSDSMQNDEDGGTTDGLRLGENNRRGIDFGFTVSDSMQKSVTAGEPRQSENSIGNVPSIIRLLRYVESREEDHTVRGHIQVFIESLDNWMERYILRGLRQGDEDSQPSLGLGDKIAGLDLDPLAGKGSDGKEATSAPKIEEIE